ncbi:MAG: cysteine--tRNA ligase, partial [archaeon]
MTLKLFNSLTRKKEEFKTVIPGIVRMYNCGPTVYDFAHLGNFKAYVFADLVRRYLEFKGFKVRQVMNITDVGHLTGDDDEGEDKIEEKARKEKKTPKEISEFYTKVFLEDWKKLGLLEPMVRPKATEHVKQMIKVIEKLIENGFAYEVGGNVYFEIKKFKDYGKLSKVNLKELKKTKRAVEDKNKRSPLDFVLWFSKSKYERHLLQWDSPWGKGYPGWHIECSAMSLEYLSDYFENESFETIDIHSGGEDNLFPHHEAEIAQTQGVTNKRFVNFWLHAKHVLVEGKKMSKSLGNFYRLQDIIDKGFKAREVRYSLLQGHYRSQTNFSITDLKANKSALEKLDELVGKLSDLKAIGTASEKEVEELIEKTRKDFEKGMDDDLNVSEGFKALFDLVREANKLIDEGKLSVKGGAMVLELLKELNKVLGVMEFKTETKEKLDESLMKLITEREELRKQKQWSKADKIREELKAKGIQLTDTKEGVKWKKI